MIYLRRFWPGVFVGLLIQAIPCAGQDAIKDTLQGIYNQTMAAMRTATTRAEIKSIVSHIDMPETTDIGEDGHVTTVTREQTVNDLDDAIAQPKRETWNVRIIWASRDQDHATAVAWVYTKSENPDFGGKPRQPAVFGTIIRDKWVFTNDGWLRSSHEKLFPDRILFGVGQDTILPWQNRSVTP